MTDPRVIIIGGNPDQLHQVAEAVSGSWAISILPSGRLMERADIYPPPSLALLIPKGPFHSTVPILEAIREKLPHTPVIMIGEAPEREDIIHAFRSEVKDYLLFPVQAAELRQAMDKHGRDSNPLNGLQALGRWVKKLRRWLEIGDSHSNEQLQPGMHAEFNPESRFRNFAFTPSMQEMSPHDVQARFFGSFQLQVKGEELPLLPGEKVNALFAYLLYHHHKPVHREVLLSRFWEYTSPSSARKSLNVAMHTLRQHLYSFIPGMELVQYYNDNYSVNPEIDIATDVDQFLGHWHKGRAVEASGGPREALEHYQNAAALYQGDFLEDMYYEDWCEQERDNLKETYLILLDRLGTYFLKEEDCLMAEKVFRKMLEKDACLENVQRKLILCYYRLGRRDKAIRQYYKCAEALQKELNIEPSLSTKELFQLINQDKSKGVSSFLI